MITCLEIANASGIPIDNVDANWPKVFCVMADTKHDSLPEQIAMIATICTETNITIRGKKMGFYPIKEMGSDDYFEHHYGYQTDTGKRLGNVKPGDGALYCGHGYIQHTGLANYIKLSKRFNLDFVKNPDLLLKPEFATLAAIDFFDNARGLKDTRNIWELALAGEVEKVRVRVNGGRNGMDYYLQVTNNLKAA